ncbi:MAG: hypothetical protein ABH831_01930, partial [Candidatus Nealsonbacteria bacterium]
MPKFIKNNVGMFWIVLAVVFVLGTSFLFFKYFQVRAEEQINIIPEQISGTWFNPRAALSQDLSATADLVEFNTSNSSYS